MTMVDQLAQAEQDKLKLSVKLQRYVERDLYFARRVLTGMLVASVGSFAIGVLVGHFLWR